MVEGVEFHERSSVRNGGPIISRTVLFGEFRSQFPVTWGTARLRRCASREQCAHYE